MQDLNSPMLRKRNNIKVKTTLQYLITPFKINT